MVGMADFLTIAPVTKSSVGEPGYLRPYLRAARRHGGEFDSLLWEDRAAQAARFDALARLCAFEGSAILDVGCGRADLLDFLVARGVRPRRYVGLEAVPALVTAARRKRRARCTIVQADFIAEPGALFAAAAEVIVFSGTLNTLSPRGFYGALRTAYKAAGREVGLNFLASRELTGAEYLHWHRPAVVRRFVGELGGEVAGVEGYLAGDYTLRVRKD